MDDDWRDRPLKELSESELSQFAEEWTQMMRERAVRELAEFRKSFRSPEREAFLASPTWRLLNPSSNRKQRHAAARALAATMSTFFVDPKVRAALRRRKEGGVDRWLRHDVFPKALLLAVADREKPQSIRFGRRWVDGRRPVAPTMLSLRRLSKWLDQRARRIAGAIILDASSEAWAARIRLSRRERELVNLLTQDADRANAARRMKVAPSTVRTMLQRIKGKGTKM
jgi:DNA-binding CsgD family transcriptional regulator